MTFPLGQPVRDRNPHDASKREWVGMVVYEKTDNCHQALLPSLIRVEWENGTRSWIVETRLEKVNDRH